jgi:hypothetical protein
MTQRQTFLTSMAFILAAGVAAVALSDVFQNVPHWLGAIGEAAIVASVLGLTVDPYLKAKLSAEMFDGALRAVVGKGLPRAIQDEMRAIAARDVVREHFEVTFEFTPHDEGHVVVSTLIHFEAKNIAEGRARFEHTLWAQQNPGADSPPAEILRAKASGIEGDPYDLSGAEIVPESVDDGIEWRRPVYIPARGVGRFWGETRQVLPAKWSDTFYFADTSIGCRVRVFAPKELHVDIIFVHAAKVKTEKAPSRNWELPDAVFLPHMSFIIRWKPSH